VVASFKVLSWNLPEGAAETTETNLSQDSQALDRNLNPGTLEYEGGVLITRLWRSVSKSSCMFP
jgi:hypothetical protein